MWSIYTCVVLAVHCASSAGLLGVCTVCAGGLQYVWGCGGRGDGECVRGRGQIVGGCCG